MKKLLIVTLLLLLLAFSAVSCAPRANTSESVAMPAADTGYMPEPFEAPAADTAKAESGEGFDFRETEDTEMYSLTDESGWAPDNTEEYGQFTESVFKSPLENPLSTFSIDVDTASYSNVRRMLLDGYSPNTDAVRVEEFINYFDYDYDLPKGKDPIALGVTFATCPWNKSHTLARISMQADEQNAHARQASNFVFLIDVSGSMRDENKLPLVKQAMLMLSDNLKDSDRVSIVVYAGSSGVVLQGCDGNNRFEINRALKQLSAGGSTAGGKGIRLAYALAEEYYIDGGNNRVILCTDGDFNVGVSSEKGLEDLIERKRDSGVYLSVLGFGTGNIKDNKMETLADKGNGNYAYIDTILEAQKVLVNDMSKTLYTVAKDVKIQVEFNPDAIRAYRLVGYDNRRLNDEDFNDDTKDAGEVGAGHTVTVFYELEMASDMPTDNTVDDLVFQDSQAPVTVDVRDLPKDWLYVKSRYKLPDQDTSQRITLMAGKDDYTNRPDADFQFASAAAEFALLLKNSDYTGDASYDAILERAKDAKGYDEFGYRAEFIRLVELAAQMDRYRD